MDVEVYGDPLRRPACIVFAFLALVLYQIRADELLGELSREQLLVGAADRAFILIRFVFVLFARQLAHALQEMVVASGQEFGELQAN